MPVGFHAIIGGRFEIIIDGQFHHNKQYRQELGCDPNQITIEEHILSQQEQQNVVS